MPEQLFFLQVSIIIVNYNVRYFLEQCLHSVARATEGLLAEVIVVDNNSTDGSVAYLQARFPAVKILVNKTNTGFARACNQGLASATGTHILFLNPDTLLAEDSLRTCLRFFGEHPEAGALGVRMIDGSGRFLKESKRSFPSPLTALYKLFGMALLFPNSPVFGRYHLGHLPPSQNHEVDVLAGAFMMIRREVLDRVGSFDESFFMYGEDVDLSYRIQKGGYKNYYVAETTIIHFKGESTKRGSLNYVRLFYSAMHKFVRKHFGGPRATFFRLAIQAAIGFRAVLAALAKAIRWVGIPAIDALLILLTFLLVKEVWTAFVRTGINYPEDLLRVSFPAFTLTYLTAAYYAGLYDWQYRRYHVLRATAFATLALLAIYALLPESLRFSRGILFFGAVLSYVLIRITREVLLKAGVLQEPADAVERPSILVAGSAREFEHVKQLLDKNGIASKVLGRLDPGGDPSGSIAGLEALGLSAKTLGAQELILCCGTLSYTTIIARAEAMPARLRLRFHAYGSGSIVGSDFSGSAGQAISSAPTNLSKPYHRRVKRLLDIAVAFTSLIFLPLLLLFMARPGVFLKNCLAVLLGRKTWVGYLAARGPLPKLRPGVLSPNGWPIAAASSLPQESLEMVDNWYAKNYSVTQDLRILIKNYRRLDTRCTVTRS